jgi:histidine triad (HIT) family protein
MTSKPPTDCLFCGIVAGAIPSTQVHEDDRTLAFMDINPVSDGHLLVVPKVHATDLGDVTPQDLAACAASAQLLGKRVKDRLGADGVNLLNCWGEAAHQSVFHLHLHVIPRFAGDPERDRFSRSWNPVVIPGDPDRIARTAELLA